MWSEKTRRDSADIPPQLRFMPFSSRLDEKNSVL